jgi:pimeloyl-ACP methyl ester carboxylesterase
VKTLTANGVLTPVIDEGEGQPVVFCHGVPDSGSVWRRVIDRMDSDFRFIAPDVHGLGRGQAPRDFDLSLESRAAWLDAVIEQLEVEGPVDLVCHDFGGQPTLAWAVQNPDRVRRMILMATAFHREWRWHSLGRAYQMPIVGRVMMMFQSAPLIGYPLFVNEMTKGSDGLDEEYLRECYANATAGDPHFIVRLYRETPPEMFAGWDTKLYELIDSKPTMCLWSENDPYVPMDWALRLESEGAELHRFADVGHWMMIESPDEVAAHFNRFLAVS